MTPVAHLIPGVGAVIASGAYEHNWAHGLGTAALQLALFQLSSLSPVQWRFVPPVEWDARLTNTAVVLTRASVPPTPGHVGALKLWALPLDAAPSVEVIERRGGIASSAQLARFRSLASTVISATFPTIIAIGDRVDIPAARWSLTRGVESELAGLMPSPDVAIRVERAAIAGLTMTEGRTTLIEDGREMRVSRVRDAKGDPGIVLECKAV